MSRAVLPVALLTEFSMLQPKPGMGRFRIPLPPGRWEEVMCFLHASLNELQGLVPSSQGQLPNCLGNMIDGDVTKQ